MSKYHAKQTIIDGFTFDSKAEGDYYIYLKEKLDRGEIYCFNMQPLFTLQEGFRKNGKYYRPILYIADFEITKNDGSKVIVDVKGFETPDFRIKRKLFEKKYPFELKLVKYVKKFGGWITFDEWKKLKRVKK